MSKETVAVIDRGGRGAALVAAYAKSPQVEKIIAIPGNDFMHELTHKPVTIYPYLKTTDVQSILAICKKHQVSLVDVAQDNAVAVGLVDALENAGIPTCSPTQIASQIEWDKAYARDFMKKYQIPHPKYFICHTVAEGEKVLQKEKDQAWFVKAAGLAEGKGVIYAENNLDARKKIKELAQFGQAGKVFLLEQCLVGEEFSAFALCVGKNFNLIGTAQDHKRINNFDEGPNTGGMGCVSNPAIVSPNITKQITKIMAQTLSGLAKENRPYKGILYLGGMVVGKKVFVIEFNARWGDPEAQVLLPALKTDLFAVNSQLSKGKLPKSLLSDTKKRVAVVVTAKGYPGEYKNVIGKELFGIAEIKNKDISIYGKGITVKHGRYFVDGGRILSVVGTGGTILQAREKVYQALSLLSISGNNLHYRTDIGWRDVERIRKKV